MNEYTCNLLRNLVIKELEDRGYILSYKPDFWVDLDAETFLRINPLTYSNGYSVDSKVNIWRAVPSARVDRTYKNSLLIAKSVRKIFKEFPG